MNIVVLGLSHKTASVGTREKFAISDDKLAEVLDIFRMKNPDAIESVIVSTCNRVEIYAKVKDIDKGVVGFKTFFSEYNEIDKGELDKFLYFYFNEEAVEHLFKVASSIDSMVIGEPQILGQVKLSYKKARESFSTGRVLNQLFEHSFSCAKRVRTETSIGESPASVAYAAVELTEKIFDNLASKTAMLIGAGEMIELVAKHLVSKGVKTILVSNRTYHRAVALAKELSGEAINFSNIPDELERSDIVISSTGAPHFVIRKSLAEKVMKKRANRPIFFIDIAVPRDVEPTINQLENCYVYDIDDLQAVVDSTMADREKELQKAADIVKIEVSEFVKKISELELAPTITSLKSFAEELRKNELKKFKNKLKSKDDIEILERFSYNLVNKLLHKPISNLKKSSDKIYGTDLVESFRKLFGIK